MTQQHAVAICGGAVSGSEAARVLSDAGVTVVVFERHVRPYGKIEDGLPRWHAAQRKQEYGRIDERLTKPGVHFVPCTGLGEGLSLRELIEEWGFSAVMLANGAQTDRPLPVPGIADYEGRGLLLQNPLVYWFNHYREKDYDGPRYELPDDAAVFGGGLASIDVVKILMLALVAEALEARGIEADMEEMERKGIPRVLSRYKLRFEDLGLKGCTLYYRRRKIDMPLVDVPASALAGSKLEKIQTLRARILDKAVDKYCFRFQERTLATDVIAEGDLLVGLRCVRTEVKDGRAVAQPGTEFEVRAPLFISSLGSIPQPTAGVDQMGERYRWADDEAEVPHLADWPQVFGVGNVVTGKGNIVASRRHGAKAAQHVLGYLDEKPGLDDAAHRALLAKIAARHQALGYAGYREWLAAVTPPDLE